MPFLPSTIGDSILNLAFPQRCRCCGSKVKERFFGIACSGCWADTVLFDGTEEVCPKCGVANESGSAAFLCGRCPEHNYDVVRSLGVYEKAMSANLLHLKRLPVLPMVLVDRIQALLGVLTIDCDVILPVPLSVQRRSERGFNQAEVIAREISRIVDKPVDASSLVRKKHTPMHRSAMDRKAREMTVENAFAVTRPRLIEGSAILLVDDIYTSGATASNCAKILKKAGARSVHVFTLARTRIAHGSMGDQ